MRQLVQLQEQADTFEKLNTELIFVFREEGVDGLKKIRDKTKTTFTLAVDFDKKSSAAYSSRRMTFDNYVVAKDGTVKAVVDGSLRTRASADQLLRTLREIEGK